MMFHEISTNFESVGNPIVLKELPATALVDGQNLLGPFVGKFCMKLAMDKAKKVGIGLVAARRSNHFGIAGYYSLNAVDKNLIGWAVSCLDQSLFSSLLILSFFYSVHQYESTRRSYTIQITIFGNQSNVMIIRLMIPLNVCVILDHLVHQLKMVIVLCWIWRHPLWPWAKLKSVNVEE